MKHEVSRIEVQERAVRAGRSLERSRTAAQGSKPSIWTPPKEIWTPPKSSWVYPDLDLDEIPHYLWVYLQHEPHLNLYVGPDYVPGESGIITLQNTYEKSTYESWLEFQAGEHDPTFYAFLRYGLGITTRAERARAIRGYALTNLAEWVYPTDIGTPPERDCRESEAYYKPRLVRLDPACNLTLAGIRNNVATEFTQAISRALSREIEIMPSCHPRTAQYDNPKGVRQEFNLRVTQFVDFQR